MRPLLSILFCLAFFATGQVEAQFFKKLKKKLEKSVEETVLDRAEEETRKSTDKALDSILIGDDGQPQHPAPQGGGQPTSRRPDTSGGDTGGKMEMPNGSENGPVFSATSKFDFVPGETVIAYEDFSQDEVGDLPAKWNTSNSAEVVTLNTTEGNWMQLSKGEGSLVPEFIDQYPENFTLEFDFVYDFDPGKYAYKRNLSVLLSDLENPGYQLSRETAGKNGVLLSLFGGISYGGGATIRKFTTDANLNLHNSKELPVFAKGNNMRGKPVHVSIWRQGKRLRMYVEKQKVFDIPRAFEPGNEITTLRFFSDLTNDNEQYYVGNIRYAVGKADMRNKLMTEGKMITYGITFEKGKANLNPESQGVLKKIAKILNDNPSVKVKVVGHTDSDGSDDMNQKLSEKRAAAVKEALTQNFGVSSGQLSSEGKGESELLDKGNSPVSHAKNRRVEFVKL